MGHQGLKTVTYKTAHPGRRALLCLLLGAAILGVSWRVQQQLGIRPFSLAPRQQTAKRDDSRKSQELTVSAHTLYALQLGAFTQESAANQLSQEFSARGAAGYVYHDGEAYRVLAAAYPTRAEAQTVQTRLAAQSISTYIHPCTQNGLTLRAEGTGSQVNALKEALGYLDGMESKLYTQSSALDNGQLDAGDARDALLSEGTTCAELRKGLALSFDGSLPAALLPLERMMNDVSNIAEAVRNEKSAARIGAALKQAQLTVFFGLYDFAQGLQ